MGKKASQPRKKPGSGRHGADDVPEAMKAVRHKTSVQELAKLPGYKCKRCGRLAFRKTGYCSAHGGAMIARMRGEEVLPFKTAKRARKPLKIHPDLKQNEVIRALLSRNMQQRAQELSDSYGTPSFLSNYKKELQNVT